MAEEVNKRLEQYIPEFEELLKYRIYDDGEIRKIIQEHEAYEYKLRQRKKTENLFFQYANYKSELLNKTKSRIRSVRMKRLSKGVGKRIIRKMVRRVKQILRRGTRFFPASRKAWNEYIKFLKQHKLHSEALEGYERMLAYINDAEVYREAAKFAFDVCGSMDRARTIIFQGFHVNPTISVLYLDLFEYELKHCVLCRLNYDANAPELNCDAVLNGQAAILVFEKALQADKNVDFLFKFFDIAKDTDNLPGRVAVTIYRMLKRELANYPIVWKKFAEMYLNGLDYETWSDSVVHMKFQKDRIRKFVDTYEEGMNNAPMEDVWMYFLNTLLDCACEGNKSMARYVKSQPEDSALYDFFTEEHYKKLMIIYRRQKDFPHRKMKKIFARGLERYPSSAYLWSEMMNLCHLCKDQEGIVNGFSEAVKVAEEGTDELKQIWNLMLSTFDNKNSDDVDKVRSLVLKHPSTVALNMYLKWIYKESNFKCVDNEFRILRNSGVRCYTVETYLLLIEIIEREVETNDKQQYGRQYYEEAVRHFGAKNDELWLRYVDYESNFGDPFRVPHMYWRALQMLDKEPSDTFVEKFALRKT